MPFESTFAPIITENDSYRFAEIEVRASVKHLGEFLNTAGAGGPNKAVVLLFDHLFPAVLNPIPEHMELFKHILLVPRYKPTKKELVNYFRANGHGYKEITDITGISPPTISKYQSEEPNMRPYFPYWDLAMLSRWNKARKLIRIW